MKLILVRKGGDRLATIRDIGTKFTRAFPLCRRPADDGCRGSIQKAIFNLMSDLNLAFGTEVSIADDPVLKPRKLPSAVGNPILAFEYHSRSRFGQASVSNLYVCENGVAVSRGVGKDKKFTPFIGDGKYYLQNIFEFHLLLCHYESVANLLKLG